ncbi:YbjN domain-containing protein [Brevundimonas sp. 2R-24]|uniref:YbjN domain-containing protein n=1 Tax=Peiella sedimenti TaxID=3061083 RepID=A0ABT8SNP6_9CAUL|nr:YbjN domain-containing protein [Caulobacteraceae bacterium XZ-24]
MRTILVALAALLATPSLSLSQPAPSAWSREAASAPPFAQGMTEDELLAWLTAQGVSAERRTDSGGTYMAAEHNGIAWEAQLQACEAERCRVLEFSSGFRAQQPSAERANEWNRGHLFLKAVAVDGGLVARHPVYLSGGLSRQALDEQLELWLTFLPEFGAWAIPPAT